MLTLPLAFPGVVIGFMVIILAGRQGLIGQISQSLTGEKIVFAYSMAGLFMGYVYFSIPRTILTVMATAAKLDRRLEEAAFSLGATPFQVVRDVIIPGLKPALLAAGAICFATAMGAFGTAFTGTAGVGLTNVPVAFFADAGGPEPVGNYTVSINWGIIGASRCAGGHRPPGAEPPGWPEPGPPGSLPRRWPPSRSRTGRGAPAGRAGRRWRSHCPEGSS